jgi:Domain of unknown function (DUF1905)
MRRARTVSAVMVISLVAAAAPAECSGGDKGAQPSQTEIVVTVRATLCRTSPPQDYCTLRVPAAHVKASSETYRITGTTDEVGVATLLVPKPGLYMIRVDSAIIKEKELTTGPTVRVNAGDTARVDLTGTLQVT